MARGDPFPVIEYNVYLIGSLIIRRDNESNRAWKRRRHSAWIQHAKAERARYRESQRRGLPYHRRPLDVIDHPIVRSLDPGKITSGTISASSITSGTISPQHISEGTI